LKNLIRKILKENLDQDGLEWADSLDDNDIDFELSPGLVYYKFGLTDAAKNFILKTTAKGFRDIRVEGTKVILAINDYYDLTKLFYEGNTQGYVNRYLAESFLSDDDYWLDYSYHDITYGKSWQEVIWELVENDEKVVKAILEHIKGKYVVPSNYNPNQLDIFGELPKKMKIVKIGDRVLDTEFFNELSQNVELLGELIDEEDVFEDLKNELKWAYVDAYNTAAKDQIWMAIKDELTSIFGESTWSRDYLKFEITKTFWSVLDTYFSSCWESCLSYSSSASDARVDQENYEELQDECPDCLDPSGDYDFVDLYRHILYELSNTNDLLNPRYQEWPDDEDIEKYFSESVLDRI